METSIVEALDAFGVVALGGPCMSPREPQPQGLSLTGASASESRAVEGEAVERAEDGDGDVVGLKIALG